VEKAIAIIQARMGSTRLPGKVLMPLGDRPVLRWVLDRMVRAKAFDAVVVATSWNPGDDGLADACRQWGFACFRGSEDDVLGRFLAAAEAHDADLVVRVNADNPLVDPHYAGALVADVRAGGAEYASYRRGDGTPVMLTALSFFVEAVTRACLRRADRVITDRFEREHVTLGIYKRPETFRVRWLDVPPACSDLRLRFTLDTPADLELLRDVFAALGPRALDVRAEDVVRLVQGRTEWLQVMERLNAENPKSR
jgi:spore coat polysaccharide biosynthesis protein SpsF